MVKTLVSALRLVLILLPATVPAGAAAAPAGLVYELPAGWDDRAEGPGRRLTAPAAAPGDLLTVAVGLGPTAAGVPENLLTAWADADLPASADLSRTPVTRRQEGGRTVLTLTRKVRDPGLGDHERLYQVVAGPGGTALAKVTARGAATLEAQGPALLALLASVRPQEPPAAASPRSPPPEVPRLPVPYGETPDLPAGDPGFLPSGRGRALPASNLAETGPAGLWWTPEGPDRASTLLFFPDGTLVRHFRPGGPLTADLATMKAGSAAGDVGTWARKVDTLELKFASQAVSGAYLTYRDVLGDSFRVGPQLYRPAAALSPAVIRGRWKGTPGTVELAPDGRLTAGAGTLEASPVRGRWWAEGTLLVVVPDGGAPWVVPGFVPRPDRLALNGAVYTRE